MGSNYLMGTRQTFRRDKTFWKYRNRVWEDNTQILMLFPGWWYHGIITGQVRYLKEFFKMNQKRGKDASHLGF